MSRPAYVPRAVAVSLALASSACISSVSSQARLSPLPDSTASPSLTAEIHRSCPLGECRSQRVRMVLSSGEVLEGDLTFLSGASAGGEVYDGGAPGGPGGGLAAVPVPVPGRAFAVMSLTGTQGYRMTCEVTFSQDTRHGTGVCTAASGVRYAIRI